MNATILVVDDEPTIIELAEMYLAQEGYHVLKAVNGAQALDVARQASPDLILLDLMLPELDGWEVCKRLRAESNIPIIMLTARTDDIDKIVGLELGADDYVTKPFNPRELVARVKAVLRRTEREHGAEKIDGVLHLGDIQIRVPAREVWLQNKLVPTRAKEFDLLHELARHKGIVLTRDQLLDLVWGFDFFGEPRTVDVHIAQLRSKLAGSSISIETVWGVVYKLVV